MLSIRAACVQFSGGHSVPDHSPSAIPLSSQSVAASGLHILNIGPASGTSLHRAAAMRRLGHRVTLIDPRALLPRSVWLSRWLNRTGAAGVGALIDDTLVAAAAAAAADVVWVDQGVLLGRRLLKRLRQRRAPIVNYIIDDPFGGRDGRRFDRLIDALPLYDLVTVPRAINVAEARAAGARDVHRVCMTADELAHRPRSLNAGDTDRYGSQVCFIGTWMPERGPFIHALLQAGLPVSIWGDHWTKAACWQALAPCWRGPAVHNADEYAKIIQTAFIALGLLSKGNRDQHTTRSMEIPALGGLLCAERTEEHLALYEEGREAVFWRDEGECVTLCRALLQSPARRHEIALAGRGRQMRNGMFNETVIAGILARLLGRPEPEAARPDLKLSA
jgi:hypothetical protein